METKTALILNQKHCDPKTHYKKVQACIDYCDKNNIELSQEVAYDNFTVREGYDPSDFPDMKDLYSLRKRDCSEVIFYSVEDLGLSTLQFLQFLEHVQEESISLRCVTHDVDIDSPSGRFQLQILSNFAQYSRDSAGVSKTVN